MEHVIFCPSNLAYSISVVVGTNGGVSGWMRSTGAPIMYLNGRMEPVNVACVARGMIHLTGGLYIFSIGGHNGTFLCDISDGAAVFPVAEAVTPFCRGEAPGDAFVLNSNGEFRVLTVDAFRLCVAHVINSIHFRYVSIHRLERGEDDEFRFVLCRNNTGGNGGIIVELWRTWERTDTITHSDREVVHDVCVACDPRHIALLIHTARGGYKVVLYMVDIYGKAHRTVSEFGTFRLGNPPFHLVYVNGPNVVVWDGDNKVCIRKVDGNVLDFIGPVCMRNVNGDVLEVRGDRFFLLQANGQEIEHKMDGRENWVVDPYSCGLIPYTFKSFGNLRSSCGVLIMNVRGGNLFGKVVNASGKSCAHFHDIKPQLTPVPARDPCYSLVGMSMVWWLGGDSRVIVFNNMDMRMRWAASSILMALHKAPEINQPIAIANEWVTSSSSFVGFVTDHMFPWTFHTRFVLLFSNGSTIPPIYSVQRLCVGFTILGRENDLIPSGIASLADAVQWINTL